MNVMIKNLRQSLKELIQYVTYLEKENARLRKKLSKQKYDGKSKAV